MGKKFGTPRGSELWQAFYDGLEGVGNPSTASQGMEATVRQFLGRLLDIAGCEGPPVAGKLRQELATHSSALDLLASWQAHGILDQLFEEPIEQVAASFYLGQMAYVAGRLRTAQAYALEAFKRLPLKTTHVASDTHLPALVILDLLINLLILEINSFAAGLETVGASDPRRAFQKSLRALQEGKERHLKDFVDAADHSVVQDLIRADPESRAEEQGAELISQAQAIGKALTGRVSVEDLMEPPAISGLREPGDVEPLALAFELSRKNYVGMLQFRLRMWPDAQATFNAVLEAIRRHREASRQEDPAILEPLELEAKVFLARLEAQRCELVAGEAHLEKVRDEYHSMGDAFAENKARKYLAEIRYRRFDWAAAEAGFLDVLHTSERLGFDHDAAAAEMFLGRLYSRFGFQDWARSLFESARARLAQGGLRRELVENVFWQAAAQARTIGLEGHPREAVANAEAMLRIYSRLFRKVAHDSTEGSPNPASWSGPLQALRTLTLQERHPVLLRTMLDLRLGRLPSERIFNDLQELARQPVNTRAGWQGDAHTFLCHQIVRLILLQKTATEEAAAWPRPTRFKGSQELRKYFVREAFIDAFELLVQPKPWSSAEICAKVEQTYRLRAELDLKGGFVPSLVDISQFFADRTTFIGLLLLIQLAIEEALSPHCEAEVESRLEPQILKTVYRSITKYLNLERNFYVGPPDFTTSDNLKLWRRLQQRKPTQDSWLRLYQQGLVGGYGLSYPSSAVALGWVDSVDHASATLAIVWIDEQRGEPLAEDSFQPFVVPIEVVRAGHAEESLAPIALLGRTGELDGSRGEWIAHRLPALDKWRLFEAAPFNQPRLDIWQRLFAQFVGGSTVTCRVPEVTLTEVEERYQHYATEWFADKLPRGLFREIFGFSHEIEDFPLQRTISRIAARLPPSTPRDQLVGPVQTELEEQGFEVPVHKIHNGLIEYQMAA